MQLNLPIMSTHSPPLRHGELAHSSISVSQSRPVHKNITEKYMKKIRKKLKALIIASKLFNELYKKTTFSVF